MIILLSLVACFDLPPSAVHLEENAWSVHGDTADEIAWSLATEAPRPGVAGRTRLTGDVSCQPGPREVGVLDVAVTVNVEVNVPEWSPSAAASPEVVRRWERFDAEVRAHETGHADIVRAHLPDVEAMLRAQPSCRQVFRAADRAFALLDARHDRWDEAHGAIRF